VRTQPSLVSGLTLSTRRNPHGNDWSAVRGGVTVFLSMSGGEYSDIGNDHPDGATSDMVLRNLLLSGNLDRLETVARRFLAGDPNDATAHYFLILALIDLQNRKEAKRHLDTLLTLEPDSLRVQIAAVCYYGTGRDWRRTRRHLAEGLRLGPDVAFFHHYAAIADVNCGKLKSAKTNISRARELDPDSAEIANLYIRIHGVEMTTPEDALKKIAAYREALALDPHNAAIHHSIGEVYLEDLDDPVEAEHHFREALRMEPSERIYQRDLFQAVAKRSLVYRLMSIPSRSIRRLLLMGRGLMLQPWRIILVLFLVLLMGQWFVFALAWLAITTMLFWPGGKVYEWLLVSEIRRGTAASDRQLRIWYKLQQWPLRGRFALFLAINLTFWAVMFFLMDLKMEIGFAFVGIVTVVHFLYIWFERGLHRANARNARRKAAARQITN
jgi:tetratricopeptide (TPR) repeat protein